jgi:hypothetical protein
MPSRRRWSAGDAGRAAGRDDVQAPRRAAEAAPRKARRVMGTPHSGSRDQPRTVMKLNTPGEDGLTVAFTHSGVKPGKVSSRVRFGTSFQG